MGLLQNSRSPSCQCTLPTHLGSDGLTSLRVTLKENGLCASERAVPGWAWCMCYPQLSWSWLEPEAEFRAARWQGQKEQLGLWILRSLEEDIAVAVMMQKGKVPV